MSENIFCAAQGIRISDLRGVHCAYEVLKNESGWIFTVVLDAPRIPAFLQDYCCLLPEPGYFTLELPVEGEDAYDIYYVDVYKRQLYFRRILRAGPNKPWSFSFSSVPRSKTSFALLRDQYAQKNKPFPGKGERLSKTISYRKSCRRRRPSRERCTYAH